MLIHLDSSIYFKLNSASTCVRGKGKGKNYEVVLQGVLDKVDVERFCFLFLFWITTSIVTKHFYM